MKKIKRTALFACATFLFASNFLLDTENFLVGMFMGICLAIIFFLLADRINRYLINRRFPTIPLEGNETLVLSEPTTHYTGVKGTLGKLFLTTKRLVFVPQKARNMDSSVVLSFNRKSIKKMEEYDRAMLPTGFTLTINNGQQHTFAVEDREEWKDHLKK